MTIVFLITMPYAGYAVVSNEIFKHTLFTNRFWQQNNSRRGRMSFNFTKRKKCISYTVYYIPIIYCSVIGQTFLDVMIR